jgi:hypothetical protein
VFIEGGVSGNATCGPTYSYLLDPDHYVTFKVTNIPGSSSFNFWVDYGSDWVFVGSCDNTFSHGWAFGETSRHGGTATGAKDDHRALHYKDDAGDWHYWADNVEGGCGNPCLSNWHYVRCADTRYIMVRDGQSSFC